MDDIIFGIVLSLFLFIVLFFATYGVLILVNKKKAKTLHMKI